MLCSARSLGAHHKLLGFASLQLATKPAPHRYKFFEQRRLFQSLAQALRRTMQDSAVDPVSGGNSKVLPPWWVRYSRWTQVSKEEGLKAELRLLSTIKAKIDTREVSVGPSKHDYLHTLVGGPSEANHPPIVWMPGYGAGTGFFYRNFDHLCERFRLYSVDWLGTGLSGRPKYQARSREESEDFFLNSLRKWRQEVGMDKKMILVGHSLGGYLAARYALTHPEDVEHLVLVCPAGVPEVSKDWEKAFTGTGFSWKGQAFKLAGKLWESGFTPGSLVRGLGPWGPNIVEKYVGGRFSHHGQGLSKEEEEVFGEYFYQIAAAPGSGEYALRHLLAPGAWAYAPLVKSLSQLKVPVTFIYGESDWMRPKHAVDLCSQLRESQPLKAPTDLQVDIIPDAGHFVFLDQPDMFNRALTRIVEPYVKHSTSSTASIDKAHSAAATANSPVAVTVTATSATATPSESLALS